MHAEFVGPRNNFRNMMCSGNIEEVWGAIITANKVEYKVLLSRTVSIKFVPIFFPPKKIKRTFDGK